MITMDIALINPYTMKIILTARKVDSINAIAARISESYGWTHKWMQELARKGVFTLTRMGAHLNQKNEFYQRTLQYLATIFHDDVQFHYEMLSWLGITYCFAKTDAVYVWTRGGYNIGRYREFYPILIKVKKSDQELFEEYCHTLNVPINAATGIFFKVTYVEEVVVEYCDGIPVDCLEDTIAFMKQNIYNFQPALEMIKARYGKKIKVKYREASTNV